MLVFLDIETTGLDVATCSILEIAAIVCEEDGKVADTFHEYINPGFPIPTKIVELTKITNDQVALCRREWEVLGSFNEWLYGYGVTNVVAHNGSFDLRFLRGRSAKYKINTLLNNITLSDTMKMANEAIKMGMLVTKKTPSGRMSKKQVDVAEALDVKYGDGGAHSAIEDTMVLKKVYQKLREMGFYNAERV